MIKKRMKFLSGIIDKKEPAPVPVPKVSNIKVSATSMNLTSPLPVDTDIKSISVGSIFSGIKKDLSFDKVEKKILIRDVGRPITVTDVKEDNVTVDGLDNKINPKVAISSNNVKGIIDVNGNAQIHPTTITVTEEEAPVEQTIDKTDVTEMNLASIYLNPIDVEIADRKHEVIKAYSFDYLSYLFFQVDINTYLPQFYSKVK